MLGCCLFVFLFWWDWWVFIGLVIWVSLFVTHWRLLVSLAVYGICLIAVCLLGSIAIICAELVIAFRVLFALWIVFGLVLSLGLLVAYLQGWVFVCVVLCLWLWLVFCVLNYFVALFAGWKFRGFELLLCFFVLL